APAIADSGAVPVSAAPHALEALGQSFGGRRAVRQLIESPDHAAAAEGDQAHHLPLARAPAHRVAGGHVEMHTPCAGAVEDEPTVDLEERKVRADEDRMIGRVLDLGLDRRTTGVEYDRPVAEDHLARRHRPSAAGVTAIARARIGCSTWSTRMPSPNRHSILMVPISEGTPSRTSSVVRTFCAVRITSSYEAPPRAASCISSQMIASASGCVSFHPLARRRRASSAAVKMVSRSISVGVSRMLGS